MAPTVPPDLNGTNMTSVSSTIAAIDDDGKPFYDLGTLFGFELIYIIAAGVGLLCILCCLLLFVCYKCRQKRARKTSETNKNDSTNREVIGGMELDWKYTVKGQKVELANYESSLARHSRAKTVPLSSSPSNAASPDENPQDEEQAFDRIMHDRKTTVTANPLQQKGVPPNHNNNQQNNSQAAQNQHFRPKSMPQQPHLPMSFGRPQTMPASMGFHLQQQQQHPDYNPYQQYQQNKHPQQQYHQQPSSWNPMGSFPPTAHHVPVANFSPSAHSNPQSMPNYGGPHQQEIISGPQHGYVQNDHDEEDDHFPRHQEEEESEHSDSYHTHTEHHEDDEKHSVQQSHHPELAVVDTLTQIVNAAKSNPNATGRMHYKGGNSLVSSVDQNQEPQPSELTLFSDR